MKVWSWSLPGDDQILTVVQTDCELISSGLSAGLSQVAGPPDSTHASNF